MHININLLKLQAVLGSWVARDVETKLAVLPGSKITGTKSSWRAVTSIVSQGPIQILFNTFIDDLDDDGIKYAARKFSGNTALGGVADRQYARTLIQSDLLTLKEWTDGNLMQFSSPAKGEEKLRAPIHAVGPQTGEQFCRIGPGGPRGQQAAHEPTVSRANRHSGRRAASRPKVVSLPLHSVQVRQCD